MNIKSIASHANSISKLIRPYFYKTYQAKDVLLLAFIILYINFMINAVYSLLGGSYPLDSFLMTPMDRFGDFYKLMDGFKIADTWDGLNTSFVYYDHTLPASATVYVILSSLILFVGNKYLIAILLLAAVFFTIHSISRKHGNNNYVTFFIIVSYPMLFTLDRGNIALLVFLLLLIAFDTDKIWLSTLAIATAASFKLTPVIFLLPVLMTRPLTIRWIITLFSYFILWFLVVNVSSVMIDGYALSPHIYSPLLLFTKTINGYMNNHVGTMAGLGYGNSLYMVAAYLGYKLGFMPFFSPLGCILITASVIVFFLLWKRDPIAIIMGCLETKKLLFILIISFIVFMPVTADYYLLILFIPLIIYPNTLFSFGYFLFYGLLLGAKNFPYFDMVNNNNITPQPFLNPLLLMLLLLGEFSLFSFVKRDAAIEPASPILS